MKRAYTSGSSKRVLKKEKEERLNEVISKTQRLDQLWAPTTPSSSSEPPESPVTDDESEEPSSSDVERDTSTQADASDNESADCERFSGADRGAQERMLTEDLVNGRRLPR